MTNRSYKQFCPVAKALDVVGERWTLLLIRELLLGPRRFTDLLDVLPGLGTSLLAERLKHLEAAGLIRRERLPPPAGATAYQLTEAGTGLGPVVGALAAFGAQLLDTPSPDELVRPELGAMYAAGSAEPEALAGPRQTYQVHVDDQVFHIRAGGGEARAHTGPAPEGADVVIRTDQAGFIDLALARRTLADLTAVGRATCSGEPVAADRAALLFASVRRLGSPGM
jgi:DNA-binding HxlR family transcriptional regulator